MSDIILIIKALVKRVLDTQSNLFGWGTMEDYEAAFLQRTVDVEVLNTAGRRTAAMHFGGIAIECLLKYLIFTSLPESGKWEWKTATNDPGHTFNNPKHDYQSALRCHNKLWSRVQRSPHVLKWLDDIKKPGGHFIDIRYVGKEPDDVKYTQWRKSYRSLMGWLQENGSKV